MASTESIGLSGLLTSQRLLELTGQNIANAATPGFHRQTASLATRSTGQEIGLGVEIQGIRRQIDESLDAAALRNTFALHDLSAQLNGMRQVEAQLDPGTGSVHELLQQFFVQIEQLAGRPDDLTQRRVALNTASAVAAKLNDLQANLQQQYDGLQQQLGRDVDQINALTARIAQLNFAVESNTIQEVNAADLSDQRDQAISQLAELIDVRTVPQAHGAVNVLAAGVPLVLGNQTLALRLNINDSNRAVVSAESLDTPLVVTGGELHGLLELRNSSITGVVEGLHTFTRTLVQAMDGVQATGIGLSGPFRTLYGQRPVTNPNLPLALAGLAFPAHAGSLFVSVTNQATGERSLTELAIDPATQSLNDIAALFSGIPHLQGVIDPQTRALTVVAQNGYGFDFAGRLPTTPQTLALTGTATAELGGVYSGAVNDTFTYTVVGSGAVGVSDNLTLEARNQDGALLGSWNIGRGYEPGSELPAIQGVTARLSAGTVNDGDTFATQIVAEPDSAGLLPALGLNSFFQGDLGNLQVRADLLANPDRLGGSRTGLPGDGAVLRRLAALRDEPLLSNGTSTFGEFYADLAADVGGRVQDLEQRHGALESLGQGLAAQQQSVSGVDTNEELVRMIHFQRSFQMSARFLTVLDEATKELLQLV